MNKKMLMSLVDKVVKVDRGGPESRVGKLLTAGDDHFVLLTEKDGIVYYRTQHIKSITHNTREGMEFNVEVPEDQTYLLPTDFRSAVSNLHHQWVKINRGGPEMLEGIMDEVTDDYITIFSKDEIIRLAMYHVRNISLGTTSKKEKEANKDENTEGNNDKERSSRNRKS
ncbi:hypothetical protein LZ480_11865 [Solibacillus sp. MA9]|uniref:Spore coat protein n=1 Tax=Solibacillus palustris TaxID=2908203 RepID=A0ABS9UEB5_9BACL|nr:hypothetical protein [Solibacillus sp. MA9]MCH7322588.1 hypothetical protein [Solibacillus sp. MA9]